MKEKLKRKFVGWFVVTLLLAGAAALLTHAQTGGTQLTEFGAVNSGLVIDAVFCGDLANNTTNYFGPASGFATGGIYSDGTTANDLSFALAGSGCSALDSTTEATADTPLYANNALKFLGMACTVDTSGSNGLTLNLRAAAANITPNASVSIATTKTTGATSTFSTVNIAAGAALAVRAVAQGEDMSTHDAWCIAKFIVVP